jgi:hypothetical protein
VSVTRFIAVSLVLSLVGCRTVSSGADERTDALLADYRSRARSHWPDTPVPTQPTLRSGEYTVHALTKDSRTVLERVGVWRHPEKPLVRLSVDRLGATDRLRVRLTLARPPAAGEPIGPLVTEAWVRRDDRPEVHHEGAVPADVVAVVALAIERPPLDGGPRTLTVPAGEFQGCVGGVHGLVPLSGVVQQTRDGVLRELLEFGDDDAGWLY